MTDFEDFKTPDDWAPKDSIIKVIGVGGGGCNAVSYMYDSKIEGCSFVVCNTDKQALSRSPVPWKIQLGDSGLGAGTDPVKARNAALESQELIAGKVLDSGTKMLFITAGMGGGTGTGAAPVIAKMAHEKGILTVAVVTIPFRSEGSDFLSHAVEGIYELAKYVDSLLLIDNEKLYKSYGSMLVQDAFPKADEVLATAVRGIIEIIQKKGYVNVDFEDVRTMMHSSGMALMGVGTGSGENRLEEAVQGAMESPLLNDFDLRTCKNLLINVTASKTKQGISMEEFGLISDMITDYTGKVVKYKKGLIYDDDPGVGDKVRITVIATGFKMNLSGIAGTDLGNLILINKDFVYDPESNDPEAEGRLNDNMTINKIGFDSIENIRKFSFNPDEPPVLLISDSESRSQYENTTAIRRAKTTRKQD